jgi:hypothetical protein
MSVTNPLKSWSLSCRTRNRTSGFIGAATKADGGRSYRMSAWVESVISSPAGDQPLPARVRSFDG